MESSFESRVRARLTRLLIVAYRAFADRSRQEKPDAPTRSRASRRPDGSFASATRNSSNSTRLCCSGGDFKLSTTGGVFDFAASLAEFRWEHLYACRRMHL
jgi:hypothetical protein